MSDEGVMLEEIVTNHSKTAQIRHQVAAGSSTPEAAVASRPPVPAAPREDRAVKQRTHITVEVIDQVIDEVRLHGGGFAARNAEIEAHDGSAVAEELARDNQRLGPGLPGYHWHSVVAARGWEQPTLDGRNGGEDPSAWLHEAAREQGRKPPGPATPRSTSRPI